MVTTAAVGFGTSLSGGSHSAVAQMTRVAFSGLTVTDVDVSNMDAPGAAKDFLPGMVDYGTIDADLVFEGAEQATIFTTIAARTPETWTITFPDTGTATLAVSGYINAGSIEAPMDDAVTATIGIKCTGVATFTP